MLLEEIWNKKTNQSIMKMNYRYKNLIPCICTTGNRILLYISYVNSFLAVAVTTFAFELQLSSYFPFH